MNSRTIPHVLLFSLICVSTAAMDFTPTTFTDGVGNGSLRDATLAANMLNGTDKIILAAGEYELTVPFDNLSVTPATNGDLDIERTGGVLTIQGAGINKTVIRTVLLHRILFIKNTTAAVVLRDLTIADGLATGENGGGVYSFGSLTLQNVRVRNCEAKFGAGVFCESALIIENCTIDENLAVGANGVDGAPQANGSSGAAAAGGGIYAKSDLTITDSIISINKARGGTGGNGGFGVVAPPGFGAGGGSATGGGIYVASGFVTITRSTIQNNESGGGNAGNGGGSTAFVPAPGGTGGEARGAGFCSDGDDVTFRDCTISGNLAIGGKGGNAGAGAMPRSGGVGGKGSGGGIVTGLVVVSIFQCTLSGNIVTPGAGGESTALPPAESGESFGGGLVSGSNGAQTICNSTITGNSAAKGGGLHINGSPALFTSNIVAKNIAPNSPDIVIVTLNLDHCLIGDTSSDPFSLPTEFVGTDNLLGTSAAPIDPLLGVLKNNGGLTKTHLPGQASPVINKGAAAVSLLNDQRGTGFARSIGGVDIGAVEVVPLVLGSISATPTTAGTGQQIAFSASASGVTPITFAWNFGDASTGDGGSIQHAYTTAGVFTATVTATDANGTTASATLSLTIKAPTVGTGLDSDGDGFSDAFETSVGSSPTNPSDTPGGSSSTTETTPLSVTKAAIKLNFAKSGGDSISFSGSLPVPAGFVLAGKSVTVDAGGVARVLTFSSLAKLPKGNDTLKLTLKASKKVVLEQNAKYAFVLGKGTFKDALADEQLTGGESVASQARSILLTVLFNGTVYQKAQPLLYTAKKGKTGSAK